MAKIYLVVSLGSVPAESMYSSAGVTLSLPWLLIQRTLSHSFMITMMSYAEFSCYHVDDMNSAAITLDCAPLHCNFFSLL
jgi:hypothetical protein